MPYIPIVERERLLQELIDMLSNWLENNNRKFMTGACTGAHMAVAAMTVLDAIADVEEALVQDGILSPADE